MNAVERALRDFLDARPDDVPVAVVGGLAVSARTEPRFTRDLDFAVAIRDDEEATNYVFRLRQLGYQIVTALEQTAQQRLSTIRLRHQGRAVRLIKERGSARSRDLQAALGEWRTGAI